MVCDCGGGTVVSAVTHDRNIKPPSNGTLLAGYHNLRSGKDPTHTRASGDCRWSGYVYLEPSSQCIICCTGTNGLQAGKCGGTFVDRNLFKLLGARFGEAFTSLGPDQIGPGSSFMDQFELKKKDFGSSAPSRRAHRIPLHMPLLKQTPDLDQYYEKRSSSVLLRHEDYKLLFDPVVDTIIDLIDNQVSQIKESGETAITTIVLVGGFGSSPYLKENISTWCQSRNIRLTTPMSGA